jgi:hypothetical protein
MDKAMVRPLWRYTKASGADNAVRGGATSCETWKSLSDGRLIDSSEKGETRLQMLMVKDLARNKKGNKAETDPLHFSGFASFRLNLTTGIGLWVWLALI